MRIERRAVAGRPARRTAAGVAVVSAAALALTACSGGTGESAGFADELDPEEEITLSLAWWGDDDRANKYEEAVALFEEQNPNIQVDTNWIAFDDYWPARNTEAASGSLPDVLQMDLSYLRQYGATGQLADLSEAFDTNLDVSGFDEQLLAAGAIDGAQYGIPTSTNTLALFYNADVLDQVGVEPPAEGYTWDDYAAFVEEVHEAGSGEDPAIFGSGDYTTTFWFFCQWLIQQGTEPFTDEGELGFTEEQMAEFLELGADARETGVFFPIEKTKQLEPLGAFTVSEAASEMSWDNFLAGYVAETEQDIRMLPMPSGDNGPQMFWKPSMLLSASANTEHPAAAAALIDFLVNAPEVGTIFGTSKGNPAVAAQRDAMEVEPGSVDEQVVAFEEDVAELVTEPAPIPVEGFGAIEAEYKRLGEELQYGNVTVDEFVTQWFAFAESNVGQS
ncbi:ABC transporter substrate-binding protein [Myceligenerans salitolerans]|uniref:Extracellular solute-binding protein n=1 Tax=Myceligenerans salitolerans TaxID=1230528 RepID=A0ABS3I8J1_9MICO|nr:extracellular solute-binding protein [Myceligenerans salitolerans]MBO0609307.1 extracellular solute-binding protein [Myceligenerans salitolerans]